MTSRRRLGEVAAALAGVTLLALGALQIQRATTTHVPADLVVDQRAARAFRDGYSPFSAAGAQRAGLAELGATGLGHPPTTSLWLVPFARFELRDIAIALGWISLATLVVEALVAAGALTGSLGLGLLVSGFVATTPFFVYMATLGQVSQLIAFAYFVVWWAARRGRDGLAGAALGVACTLKLFPALMLLWLALTRRWRALITAGAVYLAAAAVVTARFGVASWSAFFAAQNEVANAWLTSVANQSLHGVVQRLWASPACELPGRIAPEALALSMLLSLALLWLAARPARDPRDSRDLSFAAFAVLSVLTSQWAWPHYDVLYVLPALIVAATLRGSERARVAVAIVVIAALALSFRLDVRVPTRLQNALWSGNRAAHLPLHAVELAFWLPGLLLFALVQLQRRRALDGPRA